MCFWSTVWTGALLPWLWVGRLEFGQTPRDRHFPTQFHQSNPPPYPLVALRSQTHGIELAWYRHDKQCNHLFHSNLNGSWEEMADWTRSVPYTPQTEPSINSNRTREWRSKISSHKYQVSVSPQTLLSSTPLAQHSPKTLPSRTSSPQTSGNPYSSQTVPFPLRPHHEMWSTNRITSIPKMSSTRLSAAIGKITTIWLAWPSDTLPTIIPR